MIEERQNAAVIGKRAPRQDAASKVTGAARYAGDLIAPGLLHARPVLSDYAHALIERIDRDEALAVPGVVAVLTASDLPIKVTAATRSGEPLARKEVVFAGQPVALVVAESEAAAQEGAERVLVDYEPLDPVLDLERGLDPSSPRARVTSRAQEEDMSMHTEGGEAAAHDSPAERLSENVSGRFASSRGDVDAAFAECAAVAEGSFRTSWVHQAYLEPQAATVLFRPDGRLIVHASTQGHFVVKDILARVYGLDPSSITVVSETLGGAFGGKIALIEPLACGAALALRRPVRLVFTRSEDFAAANPAPAIEVNLKVGARADGTLAALRSRALVDAGAFTEYGGAGLVNGRISGTYRWETYDALAYGVITNRCGGGAYRGPTAPQCTFAIEQLIDQLATELGMDPFELRARNAAQEGDDRADGSKWPPFGLRETLAALEQHPLWARRHELPEHEGIGMAAGTFPGGKQGAGAACRLEPDGTLTVVVGVVDMTGVSTTYAAIAAEAFGMPLDKVRVVGGDTDTTPYSIMSGGSAMTYSAGPAVIAAAVAARDELLRIAGEELEISPSDLEISGGVARPVGSPDISLDVVTLAAKTGGFGGSYPPIGAHANVLPPELAPSASVHLAHVRVDRDTGVVTVLRQVAAQDCGRAISPDLVEGQMRGGATQALGFALHEQLVCDSEGQLLTGSFMNYSIPKADSTPVIDTIIVEVPSRFGPYGGKGVGEAAVVAGAAAIANAVAAATGTRFREMPITPQRVWETLDGAGSPGQAID